MALPQKQRRLSQLKSSLIQSFQIRLSALRFEYTALYDPGSIRLVKIEPGEGDDELKCTLRTYSYGTIPPYQALSYVWGDVADRARIYVNTKPFFVTRNLAAALRCLRPATLNDSYDQWPIWIDAVCIDQENIDERTKQVRRMRSIYRDAERVVIWLGGFNEPSDKDAENTLDMLGVRKGDHEGMPAAVLAIMTFIADRNNTASDYDLFFQTDPGNNIVAWAEIQKLFYRPWFKRLWIIQELNVSRHAIVLWDRIELPWDVLNSTATYIIDSIPAAPAEIERIFPWMGANNVLGVALHGADTNNLLSILHHTQHSSCSDPRDKLYAILGLCDSMDDVEVDYSTSVSSVYRKWALNRISRTRSLDIFSACVDSGRVIGQPSWVPNLQSNCGDDTKLFRHSIEPTLSNRVNATEGFSVFSMAVSKDYRLLSLQGICIDRITTIGSPISYTHIGRISQDTWRLVESWKNLVQSKLCTSSTEGFCDSAAFSAFIEILSYDNSSSLREDFASNFVKHYKTWQSSNLSTERSADILGDQALEKPLLDDFENFLYSQVMGRQMFITNTGRLGVVTLNCHIQVDDEVWILIGGLTPFILRSQDPDYRLIGPCYIAGRMHGEIIRELDEGKWKLAGITLI
jgi:hypothetical protein